MRRRVPKGMSRAARVEYRFRVGGVIRSPCLLLVPSVPLSNAPGLVHEVRGIRRVGADRCSFKLRSPCSPQVGMPSTQTVGHCRRGPRPVIRGCARTVRLAATRAWSHRGPRLEARRTMAGRRSASVVGAGLRAAFGRAGFWIHCPHGNEGCSTPRGFCGSGGSLGNGLPPVSPVLGSCPRGGARGYAWRRHLAAVTLHRDKGYHD